ncbi:UDP-glucose 4-epimerase GalE [Paucisalibacillus sp. EB02]|uniref:UDP-glucose 4-epimerase GalE n=1 Tax=Paucisalibacillus sp. EB02 TaxID=1347087 RepID=UPI0005AAB8A1|nr:UDP-glucose 4-epimerase GalE [Paucisalibacillus sp. EB02]
MAILVTGGGGYIGTHVCVELLNHGYDIVVVDNFSNSSKEGIKRVREITGKSFKVYQIDLLSKRKLLDIFLQNSIDSVIHLAGYKSVGESTEKPIRYYANNIISTVNLCEIMKIFNVKQIVFSSSATVYEPSEHYQPISENFPLGATNPYGRTKQIIEQFFYDLSQSDSSWSIGILRYFNPIGAHTSGLIGEDPKGIPNNLVPYLARVAIGKLPVLSIYGDDYPTKDGTGIRDYIHVVDLALGHVYALRKVESTPGIDVYNLGTGKGYSVLEMIHNYEKASGRNIPYEIAPRRKGDVAVCYADASKARNELGWEAKRGLEEMCQDSWRWQQKNPNGYPSMGTVPHHSNVVKQ